jgi:import inner membrane translocase subunit TIM16
MEKVLDRQLHLALPTPQFGFPGSLRFPFHQSMVCYYTPKATLLTKPSKPSTSIQWHQQLTSTQAHRIITQVVLTGTRVLARAFTEAYKQASASSQYAKAQAKSGATNTFASHGLTLEEACKILNVKPPAKGQANMEDVMERFKKLFDVNDPKKGGSFYLQSKILRARERIESEVRKAAETASREAELKEGWKPKVFKDR